MSGCINIFISIDRWHSCFAYRLFAEWIN